MSTEADDALELDRRARREALAVTRSLLLQAPAGSGKTTVLTARYLALLAVVDAPEQILAITFTRKAAAEMRRRVLQALQAGEAGGSERGIDPQLLRAAADRARALGWDVIDNPARLRIQTIDALNHALATALPVAAGSGTQLIISGATDTLYRLAARRALTQALGEAELAADAELLFARLDNGWRRLERLLAAMLARRTHWLPRVLEARSDGLVERIEGSLAHVLRAELAAAVAAIPEALLREGEALLGLLEPGGSVPALLAEPRCLPLWRRLCALALTQEDSFRRLLSVREGFAREARAQKERALSWIGALEATPDLHARLCVLRTLPDPMLAAEDRAALEALSRLLVRAAAELHGVFAERGKVDYAYVAAAAGAALREEGGPSDLALRTGESLRHILVDEFQDTSHEQMQLLLALTAGWEPGDGRTLFLVGDPMQSIYQFREAEVGLFLEARTHGVGAVRLEALELRRNFRAESALVEWVNAHFARLFPSRDDARRAAVRYLPAIAAAAADPGAAPGSAVTASGAETRCPPGMVSLHRLAAEVPESEAESVLQIVRSERARAAQCSIAVLVASREHAAAIVARLRAADIALRGVDLERLGERPLIRDLAGLTRALLHGADRTAWLALLRAPWCGLTLAELEALFGPEANDCAAVIDAAVSGPADGVDSWTSGSRPAHARLTRTWRALEPALRGAERNLPLWQRVERCWMRLGGPAIYAQNVDRLDARRYLDALAAHDEPESLVGESVGEITAQLYSSAPPQAGAVEIMTMHAAKGLEWDVVILPGLARRTAVDREPLLNWLDLPRSGGGSDLLLAPIRASTADRRDSLGAYVKRLRAERGRLERVRLLYVAATRARRALHLLAALPDDARAAAPPRGTLLDYLWPAIGASFSRQPLPADVPAAAPPAVAGTQPPGAPEPAAQAPLQRLPWDWRLPLPTLPRAERLPLSATAVAQSPEYRWVGQTARAVGTVVHAALQHLADGPLPGPLGPADEAVLEPAAGSYALWLSELGVPAPEVPAARLRVLAALRRTLSDARGRWLLSDSHRQARSEWRVTGLHGGRIVSVVFDRMLIDAEGRRWVVDYKTSEHEGAGLEAFLDSEVERYRAQLARYAALAGRLGPEPVHVGLYFPLLGEFREVGGF